ncbi:MAG: NAD-dependent epimerase/dehydratase family protein [Bacteroidales bacterium]|jgi:dTDP-L-rhamnose 4-epimerase|nr:NAD-dependent epimerase/dehydratase family protein [Bacteroidales bacterium]
MRRILITGGAGFIGSHLSLKLVSEGYFVRILDNLSKQIHGENPEKSILYHSIKGKTDFIYGDVREKDVWSKVLEGIDTVVHLAAETGTGQSMYEIQKYTDVNINGTAGLLDYITNQKHDIKKIIVASSRAIYGEGKYRCKNHGVVYPLARKPVDMDKGDFEVKCPVCNMNVSVLPTDEDSKVHPTSVYGITKQTQEELTLTCCKALDISAISLRYQNVYGPGQSLKNPYTGILSIFSTCLINGRDVNIFEDGTESRDFVYIDDVVNATIAGIETDLHNWLHINVGTGIATNVMTVANSLKTLYNSESKINISGNYRIGDIRYNYADITLLKDKLQYHPAIPFEEGIKKFASWVKMQDIDASVDSYERSLAEMKAKGLYK